MRLLVTLVALSAAMASGVWKAAVLPEGKAARQTVSQLVGLRGEYRGVALFVAGSEVNMAVSTGVKLLHTPAIAAHESLLVLEFERCWSTENNASKLVEWQVAVDAIIANTKGLSMFTSVDEVRIIHVVGEVNVEWPEFTNELTPAAHAMVPTPTGPPASHPMARFFNQSTGKFETKNLVKNPLIERAVAALRGANVRTWIEEYSAIWTRLSTSTGAKEAEGKLESNYEDLHIDVRTHFFRNGMSDNVIAEIQGTRYPNQYVLIGAHYDSRSTSTTDNSLRAPGADDNGSGTATVLEIVKILQEMGIEFEYSVKFLHFGGEEQGLLGSRALARRYYDDGLDIVCMLNLDMSGWKLPTRPVTVGMKDRSVTDWLLELTDEITELYVPETTAGRSSSCCSDYLSFYENGFATVGYFENTGGASDYPHYHRSTDTPQQLNYDNVQVIGRAFLAGFMTMAVPVAQRT